MDGRLILWMIISKKHSCSKWWDTPSWNNLVLERKKQYGMKWRGLVEREGKNEFEVRCCGCWCKISIEANGNHEEDTFSGKFSLEWSVRESMILACTPDCPLFQRGHFVFSRIRVWQCGTNDIAALLVSSPGSPSSELLFSSRFFKKNIYYHRWTTVGPQK